jgi:hypothetical protein
MHIQAVVEPDLKLGDLGGSRVAMGLVRTTAANDCLQRGEQP